MAWEKRGNNLYLYQKMRIDGKVKSVYVGRGEVAVFVDRYEQRERKLKKLESEKQKSERRKAEIIDEQINEFSKINQSLVDALFLINGFHQHKRQWRKKRK